MGVSEQTIFEDIEVGRIWGALAPLQRRFPELSAGAAIFPQGTLDPHEQTLSRSFSRGRLEQFIAGRIAAKRALSPLGYFSTISADEDGVPIFPDGSIGSIAHKYGRGVALATAAHNYRSIGIDLELDEEETDEDALLARVRCPNEILDLDSLRRTGFLSPATWVLSAKEAVFKAVFPVERNAFDFDDLRLELDCAMCAFRVVELCGRIRTGISGAYELSDGWLVTIALWSPGK